MRCGLCGVRCGLCGVCCVVCAVRCGLCGVCCEVWVVRCVWLQHPLCGRVANPPPVTIATSLEQLELLTQQCQVSVSHGASSSPNPSSDPMTLPPPTTSP